MTLKKKRIQVFETKCLRRLLRVSYLKHTRPTTGDAEQDQLPCWQLSRSRRKLARFGHVTPPTASPKPSFRAPRRVGDAVVGRGNAAWTTSKSGHICPCQNSSRGHSAEKTGRGSPLNRLSCPPDDPICQGTEMNCHHQINSA